MAQQDVSNVRVSIESLNVSATTNSSGRCTLNISPGTYDVKFEHDDFETKTVSMTIGNSGSSQEIQLVRKSSSSSSGDSGGGSSSGGSSEEGGSTDPSVRTMTLSGNVRQYAGAYESNITPANSPTNFENIYIKVYLVTGSNGASTKSLYKTIITDSEGHYEITGLKIGGHYILSVNNSEDLQAEQVDQRFGPTEVDMYMKEDEPIKNIGLYGKYIYGWVTGPDNQDKYGIGGATVTITDANNVEMPYSPLVTPGNGVQYYDHSSNGRFLFYDVSGRQYKITVSRPGYTTKTITLNGTNYGFTNGMSSYYTTDIKMSYSKEKCRLLMSVRNNDHTKIQATAFAYEQFDSGASGLPRQFDESISSSEDFDINNIYIGLPITINVSSPHHIAKQIKIYEGFREPVNNLEVILQKKQYKFIIRDSVTNELLDGVTIQASWSTWDYHLFTVSNGNFTYVPFGDIEPNKNISEFEIYKVSPSDPTRLEYKKQTISPSDFSAADEEGIYSITVKLVKA